MAKIKKQYGRAIVVPESINREAREVDVVFATETPVRRWEWTEEYDEILVCEASAVRTERIDNGLPVMDCHNVYSVFSQLGRSTKVWFTEDRKIWATLRFSKSEQATQVFQDIADGIVRDISVGYRVYAFSREERPGDEVPIYRATDWMPHEISFAPVQADVNSVVRSNGEDNEVEIINKSKTSKRQEMIKVTCPECGHEWETEEADSYTCPECGHEFSSSASEEEETGERTGEEEEDDTEKEDDKETRGKRAAVKPKGSSKKKPADITAIRAQATEAQRGRLNDILRSVRAAKLPDAYGIELYMSDKSVVECRQAVIEKAAKGQTFKPSGAHNASVGEDSIDKKRNAAINAILHRVVPETFKLEQGNTFRGMTLTEMAKEFFDTRGVKTRGKTKAEIADIVFGKRAHSTSDFPVLFEGAMEKLLRGDYAFEQETWPLIARQTSVTDFREKNFYQVESTNGMIETPEGGEIKYTTLMEAKQKIRVKKYAEGIKFTREAFINDDLDALSLIPNRFVKDWDELRGDLVWGMLIGNVTMDDKKSLFHADHKNLATGANTALSDAALEQAVLMFARQKALDGKRRIRVEPKTILLPWELKVKAMKLMSAITAPSTDEVNVWVNTFNPIVESRLEDPTAWYLAADPNAIDGLYYAYLDGNDGLRVNSEDDFNTDTMKYAVRGEFGVAAIDYRGIVKMAGK